MDFNQELINKVITQIMADIGNGDLTAIEELLKYVPEWILEGFLVEEQIPVV